MSPDLGKAEFQRVPHRELIHVEFQIPACRVVVVVRILFKTVEAEQLLPLALDVTKDANRRATILTLRSIFDAECQSADFQILHLFFHLGVGSPPTVASAAQDSLRDGEAE